MTSRYPAIAPAILDLFAIRGAAAVDVPVLQPADPSPTPRVAPSSHVPSPS